MDSGHFLLLGGLVAAIFSVGHLVIRSRQKNVPLSRPSDRLGEEEREALIEQQRMVIHYQQIINDCSGDIIVKNNLDASIGHMLERIGAAMRADRCYIFQYIDDFASTIYAYEWCSDGIEAQMPLLPEIPMPADDHWTVELQARRMIEIPEVRNMPEEWAEEQQVLSSQNIRSVLIQGIWLEGKLWGFVGVDFVRNAHTFTESERLMMQSAGNLFLLAREQRRQMNLVADSVELQRQIFESTAIPLVLFDLDYNIVAMNPSACGPVGCSGADMLGDKCYHVLCGHDAPPDWCPMPKAVREGKPVEMEYPGHGRCYWLTVQPIFDREGKPLYVLESAVDITDLHKQREELERSHGELLSANTRLREAMDQATAAVRAKSVFLTTMSHEIRTPLNAIIAFSELLQQSSTSELDRSEYLCSITLAGNALLQLINDILDLSKLEAGQMDLITEASDLEMLCRELVAIFSLRAREKGVALALECAPEFPVLFVNVQRLRQVLLNLVGNAVKFTEQGRISIQLVFTPADAEQGTLQIRVVDSGCGIQEEYLSTIFDSFVQQPQARMTVPGTGLGLTISRRLAEHMGGVLEVESTYGVGSCFTLTLPQVRFAASKRIPAAVDSAAALPPGRNYPRKIMVVDDMPLNVRVLTAMLKHYPVEVVTAASGPEALELLKSFRPELILTDMWMPGMDGLELAEAIRQCPDFAGSGLVLVTADTEMTQDERMKLFDRVLLKPLSARKLEEMLESFAR